MIAPPPLQPTKNKMNTIDLLKTIHGDMENTKHWLEDRFLNPSALSSMSARFQNYAQQLKELDEARVKDLRDNGPKVTGDICDITITLLRPDAEGVMKEKHIPFGEYSVDIASTDKEEKIKSFKLDGPPDADGLTYYIHASPGDWGHSPFGIWISKEEATKLKGELGHLYDDDEGYYEYDTKCSFCGSMQSECGGDHGDEMRDIMREHSREGRRY